MSPAMGLAGIRTKLSCPGVKLHCSGFIVTKEEAIKLGLGSVAGIEKHLLGYRNGRDLTNRPREVTLIDLFGLSETEAAAHFPSLYQHVLVHVKPEREQNNRDTYRLNWWIFGEPRRDFRPALEGLPRYIATVETSKHRFFTFLDQSIRPDNMLIAIASDDAFHIGVLSSQIHVTWALTAGGRLGYGNDPRYNKSRCFDPFPFPALSESPLKQRIRDLGERLDAHRKRQQELHPDFTLTGMYNVLEKLRSGEALNGKEKDIHDKGLVSVLQQKHDELDETVLEAYGWGDIARQKTEDLKTEDAEAKVSECGGNPDSVGGDTAMGVDDARPESAVASRRSASYGRQAGRQGLPLPAHSNTTAIHAQSSDNVPSSGFCLADVLARGGPEAEALEQQILTHLVTLNHERAAVRKLLPTVGRDPEALSACFGRKAKKRTEQIAAIIAILESFGHL